MADHVSKAKRSEIMSLVKSQKTGPEQKVSAILRDIQVQYRCNVKSLPGEPDFSVRSAGTLIFVHGCFWHGHKNCSKARIPKTNKAFWRKKVETNKKRDAKNYRLLRKDGWHVLTIWQCSLRYPERVKKRIANFIEKNRNL